MKHRFQPKFEAELIRALQGHSPWKQHEYREPEATPKQKEWLVKLKLWRDGMTKAEASGLLDKAFSK